MNENMKKRKLTQLKVVMLYPACVALVFFFQLVNLWSDGTPVEFSFMSLVVAPLIFGSAIILGFILPWRLIRRRGVIHSPFVTVYLKSTLFFLVVMLAGAVVDALLTEEWSLSSFISILITVPIFAPLYAWADPEGERKKLAGVDVSSSS